MWQRTVFLVLGCSACVACDSVPGTDAHAERKAKRSVSELLIDPTTADFRNVVVMKSAVCGEVNAKNKMGAFVGFSRFVVPTDSFVAQVEQEFDLVDLLDAQASCRTSTGYSACSRALELSAQRDSAERFERDWNRHCGPIRARRPFQPTLAAPEPVPDSPDLTETVGEPVSAASTVGESNSTETREVDANMHLDDPASDDDTEAE